MCVLLPTLVFKIAPIVIEPKQKQLQLSNYWLTFMNHCVLLSESSHTVSSLTVSSSYLIRAAMMVLPTRNLQGVSLK